MARVTHTIKGHKYEYEHTRVGKKVVCTYIPGGGSSDYRTSNHSTRLASSPYNKNSYSSQSDLDSDIRTAYAAGYGVRRIQKIFGEIDLHPTRRETENYLKDLGIELRTRTKNQAPIKDDAQIKDEVAQMKQDLATKTIEQDSTGIQITEMKACIADAEKEKLRLKEALMDIRDKGRVPTDDEIERLIL